MSTAYKGETVDASDCRTVGMDADSSSYPYSTIGERHWKAKDLILIPEMFALEMQAKGWYVRQQIVWSKKAPMPESVRDRFTSAWEPIWMFSKSPRYFFDQEAVRVPALQPLGQARLTGSQAKTTAGGFTTNGTGTSTLGTNQGPPTANMRNVWHLSPEPSREAHYASYPTELVRRCILAGTSERGCCPSCGAPWTRVVERKAIDRTLNGGRNGFRVDEIKMQAGKGRSSAGFVASDTLGWQQACSCPTADPVPCVVLDCFGGSGTTGLVADRLGRDAILVELNPEYCEMARRRIEQDAPMVSEPVEVVSAADAPHDALSLFDALEAALIERGGAVGRAR